MTKKELEAALALAEELAEEQGATIEDLKKQLAEQKAQLNALAAVGKAPKKAPTLPEPFEFLGKMYKFRVTAFILGQKYISSEVIENLTTQGHIIAALIERGSNVLEEVTV